MSKPLFILVLFGVPAALSFMQARKMYKKWFKANGTIRDDKRWFIYSWALLGIGLVLMGLVFFYESIDPNFKNIGKP
jgi:hypothetical protein